METNVIELPPPPRPVIRNIDNKTFFVSQGVWTTDVKKAYQFAAIAVCYDHLREISHNSIHRFEAVQADSLQGLDEQQARAWV